MYTHTNKLLINIFFVILQIVCNFLKINLTEIVWLRNLLGGVGELCSSKQLLLEFENVKTSHL